MVDYAFLSTDKNTCPVRQSYKCGQEPCVCKIESEKLTPWMKFLNAIVPGYTKSCVCNKICNKIVEVQCKRGTCDKQSETCKCFPCWSGPTCSVYENKHNPRFSSSFKKLNVIHDLTQSKIIGRVVASDSDKGVCKSKLKCPCADISYNLLDGGDGTFSIDSQTGDIVMHSPPFKDDYILVIGATNAKVSTTSNDLMFVPNEDESSKMYVQVDTRRYDGNKISLPHIRSRRAVTAGTLVLTLKPLLTTKFYYDIGDQIIYTISLSHNSSLSAVPVSDVKINITSDYLSLSAAGIQKTKTGAFTASEAMNGQTLELSLNGAAFGSSDSYTANVTTTVKNTIGPLSNLKLTAVLNATADVHLKKTSSPVIYAVYPKVNLTRFETGPVTVYGTTNFSMKLEFPKLNYSLLAELTTNIEDFVFMEVQSVRIVNKGANVHYNGTASPQYYSTNNDGKYDRVVIDFGYLRNNEATGNTMEIFFTVKLKDHVLLATNTKHWIGVGLQAGMRVLWVEQQAFNITKNEPSLDVSIVAANFTNVTRLFIGDNLPVSYTIKHASTSTANAANIKIICIYENLFAPQSEISANKIAILNATSVTVKPNGNAQNTLNSGSTLSGLFNLQLPQNVTPFVETKVKFVVTYENVGNVLKDPVVKELAPNVLAGTPSIIMSIDAANNNMKPGERRNYTVKVLLTKMRCPIRFELVMPTIANQSIFNIMSVEDAVIGANIQGLNTSAKPILKSSNNDGIQNLAIYDLGIGINTNADTTNTPSNTITLSFQVILNDHNNVTNGSSHWVGAGLVGKPKMIWVGQIVMTPVIPANARPWLYMKPEILPGVSGSGQYPDYKYSIFIKHKPASSQFAHNVKIRFFLPEYVVFKGMVPGYSSRLTQKQFGGSRMFDISGFVNFPDTFNFTFNVGIDPNGFPGTGKIFITTPIYLLYKNRLGKQFTLVKVLRTSVNVPETQHVPTVTPVSEYYEKGIAWHDSGAAKYVYVCSDAKAQRLLSACYVTKDGGNTWEAVDSRVASIAGHDSSGKNIYGIARNKLAYMKYDDEVKTWVSIRKSDFSPAANKYVKLKANEAAGDPGTGHVVGSDKWGVSKDGVFKQPSGSGPWNKKSIWL
eukprot:Seg1249.10 transcript_id=Seg1249.10/GoldUCD/mRNA.D3Y31 product="hypothetical protein" protein_id=Seg1249.10/GoldUCD/D3Y31